MSRTIGIYCGRRAFPLSDHLVLSQHYSVFADGAGKRCGGTALSAHIVSWQSGGRIRGRLKSRPVVVGEIDVRVPVAPGKSRAQKRPLLLLYDLLGDTAPHGLRVSGDS